MTGAVMHVAKCATQPEHAQIKKRSWPHGEKGNQPRIRRALIRKRRGKKRGTEAPVVVARKAATEAEVEENNRASP
jgi:hypothetical protein